LTHEHNLRAEAATIRALGASVADATDIGAYAIEYALNNWEVGPLCDRVAGPDGRLSSRIRSPHGKDPVGRLVPNGFYDFTTDTDTIARWWSSGNWNIGIRVPESMFVLDVDNLDVLADLEAEHGKLPETLTTISGRAAGGRHYWFWHPGGRIRSKVIPQAIETKTRTGYLVAAPSIHPHSGNQYQKIDAPVVHAPRWLVNLVRRPTPTVTPRSTPRLTGSHVWGRSPADDFNASSTWAEILMPHGWSCPGGDTEGDGARWLHPAATSSCSATIRHGLLFVYSTSTAFDTTEPEHPKGYSKFRAWSLLNHRGDMSAAAKALNTRWSR
jgi:hypothetical protein